MPPKVPGGSPKSATESQVDELTNMLVLNMENASSQPDFFGESLHNFMTEQLEALRELCFWAFLKYRFTGCVTERLSVCTLVPLREGNSMSVPACFIVAIRNRRGCCKKQQIWIGFEDWKLNQASGPRPSPLSPYT